MRSLVMLAVLAGAPAAASAQRFPGAGGLEVRVGVAAPEDLRAEDLSSAFSLSGDVDLGYVGRPWLRFIGGINYFAFDVEEGDSVIGDASDLSVRGGLRADAFPTRRTGATLLAALSLHSVSAAVSSDPTLEDLLEGIYAGLTLGVGARYALDDRARAAFVAEVRRTFVTNIDHWAFEAGFRYTVRGTEAYEPVPQTVPAAPGPGGAQASESGARAGERERLREQESRRAEDEARRAERDRQASPEAEAAVGELEAEPAPAADAEARIAEALAELDRTLIDVAGVTETERGVVVTLGSGTFASGQATLTARSRSEVGRIARVLQEFQDRDVLIEGHTDAVGEEPANQALSERRAAAVRAALIAEGVSPRRITARGFGESRPISDNDTPAGRAENRRVEIVVLGG